MCVFITWDLWICDYWHEAKLLNGPSQVVFACLHVFSFLFFFPVSFRWLGISISFSPPHRGKASSQTNVEMTQQCQDEANSTFNTAWHPHQSARPFFCLFFFFCSLFNPNQIRSLKLFLAMRKKKKRRNFSSSSSKYRLPQKRTGRSVFYESVQSVRVFTLSQTPPRLSRLEARRSWHCAGHVMCMPKWKLRHEKRTYQVPHSLLLRWHSAVSGFNARVFLTFLDIKRIVLNAKLLPDTAFFLFLLVLNFFITKLVCLFFFLPT